MTQNIFSQRQETSLYLERAKRMLEVAELILNSGFFASTINRAYYAFFYAANAALASQGMAHSEHSGAIYGFEEYFVRRDLIEDEFGQQYGRVLDERNLADFEIREEFTADQARTTIEDARQFVIRVEKLLKEEGWL